jgi:hypothetical protein
LGLILELELKPFCFFFLDEPNLKLDSLFNLFGDWNQDSSISFFKPELGILPNLKEPSKIG